MSESKMIERGSTEHLKFVLGSYQDTLRTVGILVRDLRNEIAEGRTAMVNETLDTIEMLIRGYGGSGER